MIRFFFAILLISGFATAPAAADVSGPAQVIDGDTLMINGDEIDLSGIDAPERDQTCLSRKGKTTHCGKMAIQYLSAMVGKRPVICKDLRVGAGGRTAAACKLGWLDINESMVSEGWALADPADGAAYRRAETFAKARHEGMWRGRFLPPWAWRAGQRLAP